MLALGLEDHDLLHTYYLDTQTGEVLIISEEFREDDPRTAEIAEEVGIRFLRIEPMASHEGYRIMEDFVRSLPPSRVREKLEWSLEGPKPFRRFKTALREDDEVRKEWFDFHKARMSKRAIEWLADHDIRPEGGETESGEHPERTTAQASVRGKSELEGEDGEVGGDDDLDEDNEVEELEETGQEELFDPLTEEEETELMEFLEPFRGEGVSLAKLHGIFTALAVGPGLVPAADLLSITIQASGRPTIDDPERAERITELLNRFYYGIVDDLASEIFVPRLRQQGIMVTDIVSDISSWCQGFVLGMDRNRPAWQNWFKDLRREKAISVIIGTARPKIQEKLDIAGAEEVASTTYGLISDLVPLISSYWRFESGLDELVGPQAGTVDPRIGRNRPCPCGSGKKYKHCCGKGNA